MQPPRQNITICADPICSWRDFSAGGTRTTANRRLSFVVAMLISAHSVAQPALSSSPQGYSPLTSSSGRSSAIRHDLPYGPSDLINAGDYGVKCDGRLGSSSGTDNAAALQSAFAAGAGKLLMLPPGVCNYSKTLAIIGTGTTIVGQGRSATILQATFSLGDELEVGSDLGVATYDYTFRDFTMFSSVRRDSGYTIHLKNTDEVLIENVENNSDLLNAHNGGNVHYNGILSNRSGTVRLINSEIWSQNETWTLVDSSNNSIVNSNLRYGTKNLHLAGGSSAFACVHSNIESGWNNVYVDNSMSVSTPNAGASFGNACYIDTAVDDNLVINTQLGGINVFQFTNMSIETSGRAAIHVISAPNNSQLIFANVTIGSTLGAGVGDGLLIDDCSPRLVLAAGSIVWHNTGYGIRVTCLPRSEGSIVVTEDTQFVANRLGDTNRTAFVTVSDNGEGTELTSRLRGKVGISIHRIFETQGGGNTVIANEHGRQFQVGDGGERTVNSVQVRGAPTGGPPQVSASGPARDISLLLAAKGEGSLIAASPLTLAFYTYAMLPIAGNKGRVIFCSDCLKPGEQAGKGSGMVLFDDGRPHWVTMSGAPATN